MSDQIRRYISIYGGSGSSHFSNGGSSRYVSSDPLAASSAGMYSAHDRRSERVSSLYSNETGRFRISSYEVPGTGGARGFPSSMIGAGIGASPAGPAFVPGVKRSAEALYHQTILGSHTSGQTEALFSTNSLVKRPRHEIASNLPIYPQRPGEKDCAHYMMTRICKFGDTCKFDHPIWVPEGGIPDWKEIPFAPTSDTLPERPGEPDCPYYIKTQKCKYGFRCKFNHPKNSLNTSAIEKGTESTDSSVLPERPSEPICSFYVKFGTCKFGASCKFHHPKDAQILAAGQDTGSMELTVVGVKNNDAAGGDSKPMKTFVPFTPALLHNSKGLPIRSGEADCPFYLKTGSCKYGAMCRYNHPDINSVNLPALASLGHATMASTAANLPIGVLTSAANLLPNINPHLAQTSLGVAPMIYAQRPGQVECDFYMKTGQCSFGERCKFHHPIDRSAPTSAANQTLQQNVKLTLAGLPRREGAVSCPFYMKTGTCKYGALCRFDHPPPGEAIAMATAQETGLTAM